MSRHAITVTVNGSARQMPVEARQLLVHLLREDLGLTSPHVGCDTSQCGACTVYLDAAAVKSCTLLAVQADGARVDTFEGYTRRDDHAPSADAPRDDPGEDDPGAAPVLDQQRGELIDRLTTAFHNHHALQCGFCSAANQP